MAVDAQPSKQYNSKTMLDKNGNYPVWFSQRSIKNLKKIKKLKSKARK
jgi:hypothetical protein